MTVFVLKTDGGAHPPESWADVTAQMIFPTADVAPSRLVLARTLQTQILGVLVGHHSRRQDSEQSSLSAKGDDHLGTRNDATAEATAAYLEVQQIVKGSPWEDHFNEDAVRDEVIRTIAVHMQTISHIERSWHCRRSQTPAATAWLAQHHS